MSVYFAQVGQYVKVGHSTNPERRVRNLFRSGTSKIAPADCPRDLASRRLLASIPGDRNIERACHVALDDYAVGCEFFVDEPGVRRFIAHAMRGELQRVERPEGPVMHEYHEGRDLAPHEFAHLRRVLNAMFRPDTT